MNYKPKGMSVDELEVGLRWLFSQTYNEEQFNKRNYMVIEQERL
ncbi:MAG: hypothetical protein QF920_03605 [Verrucomicrobiota bacterium]|nr:hypothetical protein [Verrucomicrobiota bacterium]